MPIVEVVNALFITYIATELSIATERSEDPSPPWKRVVSSKFNQICAVVVAVVNVSARLHLHFTASDASSFGAAAVTKISHVPRVLFAAIAYVIALYFDCKRSDKNLNLPAFGKRVGIAFCRVAPVYPFLAVAISFVFLFIVSIFEHLHLPLELLNMPIYYGTLYGPFSWIYYEVKRRVVQSSGSLPTSTGASSYYARHEVFT